MSHLLFDTRDWKFLFFEYLKAERLLTFDCYKDFDRETLEAVLDEGVKFAVERIAPLNEPGDREGCHLKDGAVTTPKGYAAIWKEMGAAGWIGATKSQEFGGQGIPVTFITCVAEAMNAACQAFYMYAGLSSEAGLLIENFASDDLKRRFVQKMYTGEWGGTMCLTEAQAGSAVGDLSTSAELTPDGDYLIEGNKIFISGGDAEFYDNVVHMVLARIKGDPAGTKGISLFVVPKFRVGADGKKGAYNGVYVEGIEHKLGINGSATCQLSFGQRGETRGYLVGEARQGLAYMFQMMNHARIACGLQGTSYANAAYQRALDYAKQRKQGPDVTDLSGPSVEIVRHPDVRRNLMTMKAYGEGTRALLAQLAFWADIAHNSTDEAERARCGDLVEIAVPIAKAYATDKGFRCTELAVQVYGGYGYCRDYPVEQYLRDCKISSLYEGTNGIQALDLLGRKMRQKGGQLFMTYIMELSQFVEANRGRAEVATVVEALAKAQTALGEVAFWLSTQGRVNLGLTLQQASPFLELFGDVMVGHQLAGQALVAADKLTARCGTVAPSKGARMEDAEIRYYAGKVDTAKHFATEVLSLAAAKAAAITSGNTAAVDMVF